MKPRVGSKGNCSSGECRTVDDTNKVVSLRHLNYHTVPPLEGTRWFAIHDAKAWAMVGRRFVAGHLVSTASDAHVSATTYVSAAR